jgi:hypothetical protein
MRTYPASYTYANAASEKSPRFVVGIIFDTDSIYVTSHPGIPNVPGVVIENVLTVKEAVSMRIVPDEGRSEIGAVSFDVLDLGQAFTTAVYDKHTDGKGLRGRKVVMYHGFAGADFTQFQVFQTQIIASTQYNRGVYAIRCADISREQRKEIFDPKRTRLSQSIDAADTTIDVVNTDAFEMVAHGTSFSDAPSSTVGYFRLEKEIIRYTGKTSGQFTGCTRGALNTRAVPHTVDPAVPDDRKTEAEEVIYLELPGVKLIIAILTGELYGQLGESLPSHWHLGIDPDWVRYSDFLGIGVDLWDVTDDAVSFVPRFQGLKKTDGKRFLESEVYQLIGCYPLIYADGTLGIRRMNRVLADASFCAVFDASNISSWSALVHDMEGIANDYQVQWNFDQDDKPTRITRLIDGDSIAMHGTAPQKVMKFKGLYGSRHTDATVKQRLDSQRDRYAHPPQLLTVNAMPRLNVHEVGDIVRVWLPNVRDYLTDAELIRSMEIQRSRINLATGEVEFELFGSTGLASTAPTGDSGGEGPLGDNNAPDDFYDSEGTELGTVVDLTAVGGGFELDPGTWPITGDANLTADPAIYYVLGDLTIPAGVTIEISDNVQLRVMGFLTVNGTISGVASGKVGIADTAAFGTTTTGTAGFGTSRAMDGIAAKFQRGAKTYATLAAATTVGMEQVPSYEINLVDGTPPTITGLPTDLRGTSGGPGGKVVTVLQKDVEASGGTGGDGGAGLCIICRGLAIGASGQIDLSGGDSAPTSPVSLLAQSMLPGAGAPGCPGALLIVIDGNEISLPDVSGGKFWALTGLSGAPRENPMTAQAGGMNPWLIDDDDEPWEGYLDPATTHGVNMAPSAYRIQYLPSIQDPVEDQPSAVPPPTGLAATGVPNGILLTSTLPAFDLFDGVEVWMATTNDRTGATKVAEVKSTSYTHGLAPATTRYFWERNRKAGPAGDLYSTWEPVSSTGGVSATST